MFSHLHGTDVWIILNRKDVMSIEKPVTASNNSIDINVDAESSSLDGSEHTI